MQSNSILIVDDEEQIRKVLKLTFQDEGYWVDTAEDGEQALEKLKNKTYPIVVTDIKMPGINGFDLCRAIKSKTPQTVVVGMTGYSAMYGDCPECKEAGFDQFFPKPFDFVDLIKVCRDEINKMRRKIKSF